MKEIQITEEAGQLIVDSVQRGFLGSIPTLRELVDWAVNNGPDLWGHSPTSVRCAANVFIEVRGDHVIQARNKTGKTIKAGTPVILGKDVEIESDPEGGLLAKAFPHIFSSTPYLRLSLAAPQDERQYFQSLLRTSHLERSQLTCLALAEIIDSEAKGSADVIPDPTDWVRVNQGLSAIRERLQTAKIEQEFQIVGLLCRETLISLAQAVFDPVRHRSSDGVIPSKTDANRMLEAFVIATLSGSKNEALRRHVKAALTLAAELQHNRSADFRDAALCAEGTQSVVNLIAIIAGRQDPIAAN